MDGSNFKEIGWVKGNGTTSLLSKYVYTDHFVQPGILYYYRIRQLDSDNQQQYSIIRNARINQSAVVALTISPNPAKDFLNLFISGTSNLASVELINALGQKIIQKNQVNAFGGIYQLALKGVARGIYTVVVQLPEGMYTAKAIIE